MRLFYENANGVDLVPFVEISIPTLAPRKEEIKSNVGDGLFSRRIPLFIS